MPHVAAVPRPPFANDLVKLGESTYRAFTGVDPVRTSKAVVSAAGSGVGGTWVLVARSGPRRGPGEAPIVRQHV